MQELNHSLTKREMEIIQLISEGRTNIEIGVHLHLSTETISKHRKNILGKLKLKNTAMLMRYAFVNKLIS